ncbi:MAG: NAD(P)(+) transhydrogenase (Re/Si-specific) subunit beta [Gemmatimonadetes bacterium]|nr:NAD(P)(+) transhydrogenase (Re/Si-specific) subunit beta [Gemmatimonadota bacterium]MBT6149079.1 NAD(P)(+) transhydrogenase (Re/Si-specific) subunit beta [Gemmatimonadota bacterium]MBT7863475.1 NAD(P)(+) transhydrogenase (Re/Si-specific) subunit beta [Gemmatimonadota bacterium]
MNATLINVAYLVASVLFIFGLKGLTHPRTAVRGNTHGALAMLIAIVATLLDQRIISFEIILAGVVVGSLIGALLATKIEMTDMPQLVAIFNGFGGGASVLVAGAALMESQLSAGTPSHTFTVSTGVSGLIGAVTFCGSLIAFAKLQELLSGSPVLFPGQQAINLLLSLACLGAIGWIVVDPGSMQPYWVLAAAAALLGILAVIPIGGADMPVVIAFLNSCSGLAAAATGFVLENTILIIAGSLVGASGLILTQIMCKAMNRSLLNVFIGGVGSTTAAVGAGDEIYEGKVKSTSADEVAMLFDTARRVVVVPGYGMAVAQAQHAVRDMANLLEARGIEVAYAIHPVAGRMPGHMNVLLAEAEVPYEQLLEMDHVNPTFEQTDVALVIGANDVVNPLARVDDGGPIAGMPILDVDKARTVVIIKRSLSPGFAGIANPLFAADNALMYFGSAKEAILDLVTAIKDN